MRWKVESALSKISVMRYWANGRKMPVHALSRRLTRSHGRWLSLLPLSCSRAVALFTVFVLGTEALAASVISGVPRIVDGDK
jgi:hypothetical protein